VLGELGVDIWKKDTRPLSLTTYRSQLKMHNSLKWKVPNIESTRRKYRGKHCTTLVWAKTFLLDRMLKAQSIIHKTKKLLYSK
jgi:hypothetical protein